MAEAALIKRRLSLQEFLAWEAGQPERWELVGGEPFAMAGGTSAHNVISFNAAMALTSVLRARRSPCRAYTQNMKVIVPAGDSYYPDVVVTCRPVAPAATTLDNATVIVEVLSDSTEAFDRGQKWRAYQALPDLQHYVLLGSARESVEIFTRTGESWTYRTLAADEAVLGLPALGCEIAVAELYRDALDEAAVDTSQAPSV